ncbi:MAG: hypothetical protein AB1941_01670 [Gemmatimonadota bacterium]
MRCYLKGELRRRFCLAWVMVPEEYTGRLRAFLRSVRAVPSIAGTRVHLADGSRVTYDEDAYAVLSSDTTARPPRGWLLIREEFGRRGEVEVVGAFLHELAHAFFAIEDGLRAALLPVGRGEAAAWLLVASWAAHGCLDYEHGLELVLHALDEAERELDDWAGLPLSRILDALAPRRPPRTG